ncbi:staygreen family protein [Heyndrickxia sp. NPDC080065]|uniref:staygreen family protein n=1 Tax=Heyndrickxia sp. NPDC080065 TaxID=3390568 RepID=UPI003D033BC1
MDQFDKFSVRIIPPATSLNPLEGRKYFLTHCEASGTWYLSIGTHQPSLTSKNSFFDVIQAEWTTKMGEYILLGKININYEESDDKLAQIRYMIYQKDLPNLLRLMINGDKQFLQYHSLLLDAPIHIEFESNIPEFYRSLYMGSARKYLINESVNI